MAAMILPLQNGLELTITGEPTLRALGSLLKAALVHFRNQRDIQQVTLYTAGSFQGRVPGGDCAISHPGDSAGDYLPPAAWAETILGVYQRIEALEEIRRNRAAHRQPHAGEELTSTVAGMLEQPSPAAHLQALRLSLEERENPSRS